MGNYTVPVVLWLILSLYLHCIEASPNLLFTFCSEVTGNYSINSTFESNLNHVLDSLLSNSSGTGFYGTSIRDGSNQVFGQALCRGDTSNILCQKCIQNATLEILNQCKTKEAIVWYDICQVHYSYQNISLMMVYTGKYPASNNHEENISKPGRFKDVLTFLMRNISIDAVNVSKSMFAFGEVKFKKESIYGLVQCTRDISRDGCRKCLDSAIKDLHGCCDSRTGGTVLSRKCNVRFQMHHFYNASNSTLIYPKSIGDKWSTGMVMAVVFATASVLGLLVGSSLIYYRCKKGTRNVDEKGQQALLNELVSSKEVTITPEGELVTLDEFPFHDLPTIRAATDDFSDSNKLGQGGFGTVYKAVLPDGKEVAVKRLSRRSWQGLEELKNEVILISKLQHRNLVRLLGCGIEVDEKLLIYELMPNRSLDFFIFDSEKRSQLDWKTCYEIISGIARGLVYLHEDSRLKIIHRDLKPSNVLLDEEMVAKISDFGLARIFCENQNTANTKKVVGSYGYIAPEYAMEGQFSVKSDVFSFGVIVLEILSGKKNSGFYRIEHAHSHALTLVAYAWRLWEEGKEMEVVDPCLLESYATPDIKRCLHIGLLCVQQDPSYRPTMSEIMVVLGSHMITLPEPKRPPFSVGRVNPVDQPSTTDPSTNQMTISNISAR